MHQTCSGRCWRETRVPGPPRSGPWAGPWGRWRCGPKPRRELGRCWRWEGEKDWSHPRNRRWRVSTSRLQSKILEGWRPFENRQWWWSRSLGGVCRWACSRFLATSATIRVRSEYGAERSIWTRWGRSEKTQWEARRDGLDRRRLSPEHF